MKRAPQKYKNSILWPVYELLLEEALLHYCKSNLLICLWKGTKEQALSRHLSNRHLTALQYENTCFKHGAKYWKLLTSIKNVLHLRKENINNNASISEHISLSILRLFNRLIKFNMLFEIIKECISEYYNKRDVLC